jgi:hypothetical protein
VAASGSGVGMGVSVGSGRGVVVGGFDVGISVGCAV